jgi:hypothetical protein
MNKALHAQPLRTVYYPAVYSPSPLEACGWSKEQTSCLLDSNLASLARAVFYAPYRGLRNIDEVGCLRVWALRFLGRWSDQEQPRPVMLSFTRCQTWRSIEVHKGEIDDVKC